jgi:molybdate transport system ATP-binding protein
MVEGMVSGSGLDAGFAVRRGTFRVEVALTIDEGRTVALLGPNGAGKSTVVAAIAGLVPIDEGRIELDGAVLDDPGDALFIPSERRRVGVVFQDLLLFPHLTIIDNVAFGLRSRGASRTEAKAAATEWLDRLDLADLAERRPRDLSGGQAQRVALARALVGDPDLLLLDEPLSALDVTTRAGLRRLLADHLAAFPGPRLLITHDPTEAFLLADEIHVIEDGTITQTGTADEIRLRPRTPYAADLAGANLVAGFAADGIVDTGSHLLHIADHGVAGPVLATIRPAAISIHRLEPEGSPRNAWPTTIDLIEHLGDRIRLRSGAPLALTAEITEEAALALDLSRGTPIWVSLKATEIGIEPGPSL